MLMKNGDMVIIKNPTISSKPNKSKYQPNLIENDDTIDTDMTEN